MVLQWISHIQLDSFKVIKAFANACFVKLHMLPFQFLQLYFQYITLTSRKKPVAPKSTKYCSIEKNTLEEYNHHLEEFD